MISYYAGNSTHPVYEPLRACRTLAKAETSVYESAGVTGGGSCVYRVKGESVCRRDQGSWSATNLKAVKISGDFYLEEVR